MENIIIYSDESNHDKSITLKDDILNIDKENGSREYIRSYLSINEEALENFLHNFVESENALRISSNTNYEIKATKCLKISGTRGVSKVEEKYIKHLTTLFSLLNDLDTTCIIVSCNKIEYMVKEAISINIDRIHRNHPSFYDIINNETVIYSYAKYFQNYYTENLIKPLFLGESNINYKIQRELSNINKDLKTSFLKSKEYKVGLTLIDFMKKRFVDFTAKPYYSWNYSLESEIFLKKFKLTDSETTYSFKFDGGTKFKKIFEGKLKEMGNESIVQEGDSQSETMLRVVDWLATFFGKLLRSYSNSFKMDKQEDKQIVLNTVHEIKDEWFDLTEEQFILFKVINKSQIVK